MKRYAIGETARMCGVSVRTVRYYGQLGLVRPAQVGESGYRYYDDEALARLQEILFYRELDFSLAQIARLVETPGYDKTETLRRQRALLLSQSEQARRMAQKISMLLGDEPMKNEKTQDYSTLKARYQQEARARWGETAAFAQNEQKESARTAKQNNDVMAQAQAIFASFGALAARGASPEGEEAQALTARWRAHLTQNHYDCTDEMFAGLAEMYVQDERFRDNLDQNGAGTASLMHEAMLHSLKK